MGRGEKVGKMEGGEFGKMEEGNWKDRGDFSKKDLF